MTLYLDDDTQTLVRRHVKNSGESASKWVAEAVRQRARSQWPADVLSLLGSWDANDFPDAGARNSSCTRWTPTR